MPFAETDLDEFMASMLSSKTVTVKLNGVTVGTFTGLWRRQMEFVGKGEEAVIVPGILCKASDMANYDRSHTLGIDGTDYRQFGAPALDNAGLARVGLVK